MPNPKGNAASLKPGISTWINKPTKTVRVPVIFEEQVTEYAKKLDRNEVDVVRRNNSHVLDQTIATGFYKGQKVSEALIDVINVLEGVESVTVKKYSAMQRTKIKKLISALYTLCQSDG